MNQPSGVSLPPPSSAYILSCILFWHQNTIVVIGLILQMAIAKVNYLFQLIAFLCIFFFNAVWH